MVIRKTGHRDSNYWPIRAHVVANFFKWIHICNKHRVSRCYVISSVLCKILVEIPKPPGYSLCNSWAVTLAKFPCFALGLTVSLHEYSREDIFCFIYGPSERWVLDNGTVQLWVRLWVRLKGFALQMCTVCHRISKRKRGRKTSLLLRLPVIESPKPQIMLAKSVKILVSGPTTPESLLLAQVHYHSHWNSTG